ncbi:MAG: hypothetical protein KUF80_00745 [Candidatus Thiodiazotropha sp. (ex Codakia orbicularis)]|nr:hypothetical protein [Candidatus Thiodiazotropha sp. (ex Codakia orbicularis)]
MMQKQVKNVPFYVVCSLSLILLGGCSRSVPLISHAHIGHALTAWRDTPGQQGLFVIAEEETGIALDETEAARGSAPSSEDRKHHLSNVIHALNPDRRGRGNGKGYGAIRALGGTADHLVFAAESDDASDNLIRMAAAFSEGAGEVSRQLKLATEVALLAEQADGDEQNRLLARLEGILSHAVQGKDLNANGVIGDTVAEYGLEQLRNDISQGLHNETPAYQPLGKKYLFGLVRLPSGGWAYRFDSTDKKARSRYGYGHY